MKFVEELRAAVEAQHKRDLEALEIVAQLLERADDEGTAPEESETIEPDASAEPTKKCRRCGQTKPLSEYPKNSNYKDGRTNMCRMCTRSYQNKQRQKAGNAKRENKGGGHNVSSLPSSARCCSNGERCVAFDDSDPRPSPAFLDVGNPGPLCRGCQRRAGVA